MSARGRKTKTLKVSQRSALQHGALVAPGTGWTGTTEYYDRLVPKDPVKNREFRIDCWNRAERSEADARQLHAMCAADVLFWINVWVYTYDPRSNPTELPFITYKFQDDLILEIQASFGREDLFIDKSRCMGASWCCLVVMDHGARFRAGLSFLLASRVEELVDETDNLDALIPKLDYVDHRLPPFLKQPRARKHLSLVYTKTGGRFRGARTTKDIGRSGRHTAVMLDEFGALQMDLGFSVLAATQAVSPCRILNSTPQGDVNAFAHMKRTCRKKIALDWFIHPVYKRGLYATRVTPGGLATGIEKRDLEILDKLYKYPEGYNFILDGKIRSPWYDAECLRSPLASLIAQELDRDYLGSGDPFFKPTELAKHQEKYCCPPYHQGELVLREDESCKPDHWLNLSRGRFRLWCHLDVRGKPPRYRRYVIGGDVAVGTTASNSALSVVDKTTGEKVGEFLSNKTSPYEFAAIALALSYFFDDGNGAPALLIWEANGPGRDFGIQVLKLGHPNVFWRRNEERRRIRVTDFPGWWSDKKTKQSLLTAYAQALLNGSFINRCWDAVEECRHYQYLGDGTIGHVASRSALDPSGANDNHGDIVIADALAWRGVGELPIPKSGTVGIRPGSLGARHREYDRARRTRKLWDFELQVESSLAERPWLG